MATIDLEDEFGDIIGKARMGLALNASDAAKAAGVSVAAWNAFENYEREPSEEEANKVASALGLDGDRLWAVASGVWAPEEGPDEDAAARVIRLMNYVGGWPVFSFILVCKATNECAIVDTAAHPDQIIEAVGANHVTPSSILLTHGHADHVEGIGKLQKEYGVPVVSGDDLATPRDVGEHIKLADGSAYRVGKLDLKMIKTPGHSDACVTFITGSIALIGDVIFSGSLGKPNHSYEASRASAARLFELPDDTRLYPGHGPATTVGEEKAHNPFFG